MKEGLLGILIGIAICVFIYILVTAEVEQNSTVATSTPNVATTTDLKQ